MTYNVLMGTLNLLTHSLTHWAQLAENSTVIHSKCHTDGQSCQKIEDSEF